MGVFSWLSNLFGDWERIKSLPSWVLRAYGKWQSKLPTHPYNMTKHFVGYHFVYKVRHSMGGQGKAPILGWYKKSRGLEYPEGIPKNRKGMKRWQKGNQVIYQPSDFRNPFEP